MDLPALKQPPSAILGALYRMEKQDFVAPRHSGYKSLENRKVVVPASNCAVAFRQLYIGYMTANGVVYACDAREPLRIVVSDAAELSASTTCAETGEDNSQRPRSLSIWLLLRDALHPGATTQNRRYLDGLATWCTENELVKHVRFNVLAGVDTKDFVDRTEQERTKENDSVMLPRLAVRWCTPDGRMRTEIRALSSASDGTDAQTRLQSCATTMCIDHGAPLHANGYASVSNEAVRHVEGAFDRMVMHVAASFEAVVNGCPCVAYSNVLNDSDGPLQFTGNFVRVIPINAPLESVDAYTFHGVILAPRCKHDQVKQYCSLFAEGLRAPRGLGEELMGMHICAIYIEERALGQAMSLFGIDGLSGRPIIRPHSTTLASVPFLRPLDDDLFSKFILQPCSKASLLPAEACHHEGFANFFERCMQLYMDTSGATPDADTLMRPCRKVLPHMPLESVDAKSAFVLSALRINLRSERTTVGDALCQLFSSGAPRSIITLLVNAVRHYGVNMPLCNMLEHCAELFGSPTRSTSALVDENYRLKRLALVAVTLGLPAQQTMPDAVDAQLGACSDETMRRSMDACKLVRGKKTLVSRNGMPTQWSRAVAVFAEAVTTNRSLGIDTIEHAEAILQRGVEDTDCSDLTANEWSRRVDHATEYAMNTIVASRGANPGGVFFLHKVHEKLFVLQQLTEQGKRVPCSFDTLLKTARPNVLIVQRGVGAVRFTALKRRR